MARMVLKIPKLAVSMRDGTVTEWYVAAGEFVAVGQRLYGLETEKTTFEIESPFAGTITPLGSVGESYPVGTPIAEIMT